MVTERKRGRMSKGEWRWWVVGRRERGLRAGGKWRGGCGREAEGSGVDRVREGDYNMYWKGCLMRSMGGREELGANRIIRKRN